MLNCVSLTADVKKTMMQTMQADLATYVVMELRGSKREMTTVVSKADPLRNTLSS